MSKMFDCVTAPNWNVVTGCQHGCTYCWARILAEGKLANTRKWKNRKFDFPMIHEWEFKRKFKSDTMVFVSDMGDLFGSWVPLEWIFSVIDYIKGFPKTTFLLLTKNPKRFNEVKIPSNCICGVTIESDIDWGVTKAPHPRKRLEDFAMLNHSKKMVSIEPIMQFNLVYFVEAIRRIKPSFVYVGYDNYQNNLVEPSLAETEELIRRLSEFTDVKRKTIREKERAKK